MAERKYKAFLSYRSTDKKLAARLFERLERWRTPKTLVGATGRRGPVPARAGPICRDREEFPTSAYVEGVIAEKLRDSDDLIVVCTPAAAQPTSWVGREIELFRQLRPDGEIHAVIGAGTPPDCFPAQLLRRGGDGRVEAPLAADVRKEGDGFERAVVKLIAGLIGVDFDLLWRRERRRRARALGLAAAGAVVLAAGVYGVSQIQEQRIRAQGREIESLLPQQQEAAFRRFADEWLRPEDSDAAAAYTIVLNEDLNGDGRLDFVTYNAVGLPCSRYGCTEVFVSADGSFLPAGEMYGLSNIRSVNEQREGHRSLVGQKWTNLAGHPLYHVFSVVAGAYAHTEYWYCEHLFFDACAPRRFAVLTPEEEAQLTLGPDATILDVPANPESGAAAARRPAMAYARVVGFSRSEALYLVHSAAGGEDAYAFVRAGDVTPARR